MLRVVVATIAAVVGLCGGASAASTEHLSRNETVALVSKVLADVQSNFPSPEQSLTLEETLVENILNSATIKVMNLRDSLADNHFIQIHSFAINLPSGVLVTFTFPPEDRGE
jgi:hypothetical protein